MIKKYINLPEEELINGCLKHQEKYFSMLFHKYYSKMFHVCNRYSSCPEEAKDLTQEGFIIAFRQMGKFRFQGSFEGWMRRIMINNAINYLKSKRKLAIVESIEIESIQDEIALVSTSQEEVRTQISAETLMNLVKDLPETYNIIFNMYVIDGLSHSDIASLLNIKESTSRANLVKARAKLKKAVEELLIKERKGYA